MRRTAVLLGTACLLTAAGKAPVLTVQIADTGPLAGQPSTNPFIAAAAHPALAVVKTDTAPMPNPDLDAPRVTRALAGAQLTPALLSEKGIFAGNGYARGSSQEQSTQDRRQPAAGLNLSVPVK